MIKIPDLFICPVCFEIVSQEDIDIDTLNGGTGMCSCEFSYYDENLEDVVTPRLYHMYEDLTTEFFLEKVPDDKKEIVWDNIRKKLMGV